MVFNFIAALTIVGCIAAVAYWVYTDGLKGLGVGLVVCIPVVLIGFALAAATVFGAHSMPSDRTETRVELSDDGKAQVEVQEHYATTPWLYTTEVLTAISYDFDTPEGSTPSEFEWNFEENR